MPPDRGLSTKTQKTDLKKESKISTSRKDQKSSDVNNGLSSKSKPETKVTSSSPLSRQKTKIKKEEMTVPTSEKVTKSSRIDAAKLKDVKKDLDRDLKNVRETLARNRTLKNAPYKPTATRASISEKVSSESMKSRTSNGSIGNRKVPVAQANSRKILHTSSTKEKALDLSKQGKQLENAPKSRPRKSIPRQDSLDRTKKEKEESQEKQPKKLSRERTRTRTLSPHEVKIVKGISSLELKNTSVSSKKENETTAIPSTSKLGKVNQAESQKDVDHMGGGDDDSLDNYEDDFEDYESDFEEDIPESSEDSNSVSELGSDNGSGSVDGSNASGDEEVLELSNKPVVEEEKKLDSGNYDLTESKRKGREIQQIREALEKENASVSAPGTTKRDSLLKHSSIAHDEGFEEEKPDESKPLRDLKNAVFINFASAKKKMEEQKVTAKTKKRGEELLSMIKLDNVNFSLLDLPPVPYEVYMKSYGRSNTQQASIQTNEDNLSEEIQTEEILMKNKWTQHPVAYRPVVNKDDLNASLLVYSQDHLGSGGDSEEDPELWKKLIKYNAVRLNQFLLSAGKAILQHLEQQSILQESNLLLSSSTSDISIGFFSLSVSAVPFLAGRSVSMLCFSDLHQSTMLTVHSQSNNSLEAADAVLGRCMICVWNIFKPSTPEKILVCSNNVTSACFHRSVDNLVFSGLCDGTVCVWDLQEPAAVHCLGDKFSQDWVIRSPTYSTAEILKNEGHLTEVSAIHAVGSAIPESSAVIKNLAPIQVCSVEVCGVAIVWTVIQSTGNGLKTGLAQEDLGLAYWGKVRLVRSIVINMLEGLDLNSNFLSNVECRDMLTDPVEPSHFYVCTNTGHVIHCLSSGCKPHPKIYSSSEDGYSSATCMQNMVDERYMLVGFEGGIVQLFCRESRSPLATYAGTGDVLGQGPSVLNIQTSAVHPGQFFILDKASRIHIWNLTESDIIPVKSLTFGKKVLSMKLSKTNGQKPIYLAIAMANGDVELHQLKREFSFKTSTEFEEQLQEFRAYAKEL